MRQCGFWQRLARQATATHPPLGALVSTDGGQVHALSDRPATREIEGEGLPVVLLHGASGNLRDFTLSLGPRLARRHRVIAMDRPGFGHSAPVAGAERLMVQVRRLRTALRRLGHRRVHLVGHSYGGALALAWSLTHADDVASLSLISAPTMDWGGALERFYSIAGHPVAGWALSQAVRFAPEARLGATLGEVFAPAPVPARYRAEAGIELALRPRTFRLNARQVRALHGEIRALEPRHGEIRCPVAIVHGTEDRIVEAKTHAVPLAARLHDASLTLIDGAGHMPHHSHTGRVVAAVEDAIARAGRLSPAIPRPRTDRSRTAG